MDWLKALTAYSVLVGLIAAALTQHQKVATEWSRRRTADLLLSPIPAQFPSRAARFFIRRFDHILHVTPFLDTRHPNIKKSLAAGRRGCYLMTPGLLRSFLASTLVMSVILVLWLLFNGFNVFQFSLTDAKTVLGVGLGGEAFGPDPGIGMVIAYEEGYVTPLYFVVLLILSTLLADFLSITETRTMIGILARQRESKLLTVFLILAIDALFNLLIIYGSTIVSMVLFVMFDGRLLSLSPTSVRPTVRGSLRTIIRYMKHFMAAAAAPWLISEPRDFEWHLIAQDLGTANWYGYSKIFIYSTFLTSAWLWLYLVVLYSSRLLVRLINPLKQFLAREIDVRGNPFAAMIYVGIALLTLIYWPAVLLLHWLG